MEALLKKRGTSTAVILPASVLNAAGLRDNQMIQVVVASGNMVIARPPLPLRYELPDLPAGARNQNHHTTTTI